MAIETITPGNTEELKKYTRTCPECGCKFTYNWKDTFQYSCCDGYMAVWCPTCNYPVAHVMGGSSQVNNPPLDGNQ